MHQIFTFYAPSSICLIKCNLNNRVSLQQTVFQYRNQQCPTPQWSWRRSWKGNTGWLFSPHDQRGDCTQPWPGHRGHCLLVPPLEAPWRETQSGAVKDGPKLGQASLVKPPSIYFYSNQPIFDVGAKHKSCWCDTFLPHSAIPSLASLVSRAIIFKCWVLSQRWGI